MRNFQTNKQLLIAKRRKLLFKIEFVSTISHELRTRLYMGGRNYKYVAGRALMTVRT
jgi:hypothetical protein